MIKRLKEYFSKNLNSFLKIENFIKKLKIKYQFLCKLFS